ncbi:BolA family protein [Rhodomicrobium vannielii]|uniref:BolA family protein n=1 Tax=Rhodomicrobium vannielii TaxID=1069 RepID=UPI003D7C14F1
MTEAFSPERLKVENDSHKHAHHVAMRGVEKTGETHFTVTIVSAQFAGRSLVERHRMVNSVLAEELASGVHALAIKAKSPDELPDAG